MSITEGPIICPSPVTCYFTIEVLLTLLSLDETLVTFLIIVEATLTTMAVLQALAIQLTIVETTLSTMAVLQALATHLTIVEAMLFDGPSVIKDPRVIDMGVVLGPR